VSTNDRTFSCNPCENIYLRVTEYVGQFTTLHMGSV